MQAEVVEKVLTPALRFPAFHEGWKRSKLGAASDFVTSGSRDWAQYYAPEGDLFIRMTNLPKEGITLDLSDVKYVRLPEGGTDGNRTNLKAGDILISITAELGKIGWVPAEVEGAFINQHTALVRTKSSVDSEFIAHHLSTFETNKVINRLNDSGAKAGLNLPTVKSIPVILPTLPEQQKIAAFLGAVNRKIQQLKRKQALLEQYKKGVVQQLFAQQLRFKREDGEEFPEWEEATVDECVQTISTRPYQIQSTEFLAEGPIPVVDQGKSRIAGYTDQMDKVLKNNGVIVYGDHTTEIKYIDFDFVVGADGTKLLRSYKHDLRFLYYNLAYNNIEQEGYKRHFTLLREKTLQLPSLEEQSRIAGFLMALDAKVAGVAQAVAAAERWKKGLLQQMFV